MSDLNIDFSSLHKMRDYEEGFCRLRDGFWITNYTKKTPCDCCGGDGNVFGDQIAVDEWVVIECPGCGGEGYSLDEYEQFEVKENKLLDKIEVRMI